MQLNWPSWWTDDAVVTKVIYRIPDPRLLDASKLEVRAILADQLGVGADDTEAVGIWSALDRLNQLPTQQTRGMLFILAATTLLIGGIGVLNMMLDSVHERRPEIGVRLAVGARRRDIVAQFFVETATICGLGRIVGAILGVGACLLLAHLPMPDLVPIPVLRPGIVVTALAVLGVVDAEDPTSGKALPRPVIVKEATDLLLGYLVPAGPPGSSEGVEFFDIWG